MKTEKHPAEIALEKLRDFPEIDDARMAGMEVRRPQSFRQYARPIIDAYFAPLGEKICREPATLDNAAPEQLREWAEQDAKHRHDGTGAYAGAAQTNASL